MAEQKSKRRTVIIPAYAPPKSLIEHARKPSQTATQMSVVNDGSDGHVQSVFDKEEPKSFYGGFARFGRWVFRTFSPRYKTNLTKPGDPVVYVCRHLNMHGPFTTLKWLPFHVHPMILHVYFDKEKTVKHMTEYTFSARYGKKPKRFSLAAHIMSWVAPPMMKSLQGIPVYRNGIASLSTLKTGLKYLLKGESLIVYPDIDYTGNYAKPSDIYDGFLMLWDMYLKRTGKPLPFVPLVIDDAQRHIIGRKAVCVSDFRHECAGAADYLKRAINKEHMRCENDSLHPLAADPQSVCGPEGWIDPDISCVTQMGGCPVNEKSKYKILTIPNLLSLFRLLLIPLILWLYIVRKDPVWTTVILAISGITDMVDGIIARKCHMVSDFGKAFDPVADKLTQIAVLFCLVSRFRWMLLPLCVMIVKEMTAAVLGLLVIRKTGKVAGAVWHGKATTAALYSMMLLHLIWFRIPGWVSGILIGGCTALALLSAFLYSKENIRILRCIGDGQRDSARKRGT